MKLFAFVLLTVLVFSWSHVQSKGAHQKPNRKTRVETKYDENKKETIASVGPLILWKPPANSVSGQINYEQVDLLVSFNYPGKRIVTPNAVTITLLSTSQGTGGFASQARGQFEKSRELSVSTESAQYQFGEMELLSINRGHVTTNISSGEGAVLVREVIRKSIPFDEFSQITQSSKAEIKIGRRKFKLQKEHLEAFRNFLSLMKEEGLEF